MHSKEIVSRIILLSEIIISITALILLLEHCFKITGISLEGSIKQIVFIVILGFVLIIKPHERLDSGEREKGHRE